MERQVYLVQKRRFKRGTPIRTKFAHFDTGLPPVDCREVPPLLADPLLVAPIASPTSRKGALMNYVRLGRSGLQVSPLCLGCMSYGAPDRGNHPWTLGEEDSRPFIKKALDAGINFFDTANRYSLGSSEEILGRAIKDFAQRDEVVIATKVSWPDAPRPERRRPLAQGDLRRNRRQPDAARHGLCRPLPDPSLGPRHADRGDARGAARCREGRQGALYRRLVDVCLAVRQGACTSPRRNGWTRFVSMQNHVNLLYREEEREMLPLCADEGIGVIPWSPQARGS